MIDEWDGKEIIYPDDLVFTTMGEDTVKWFLKDSRYTIAVSYTHLDVYKRQGLLDQDVHDLFQEFFPDKLYTFKKDHRFADPHDEHIKAYGYSYFKNQQYI